MQLVHPLDAFQASVLSVLSPLSLLLYKLKRPSSLGLLVKQQLQPLDCFQFLFSNSTASSWRPELQEALQVWTHHPAGMDTPPASVAVERTPLICSQHTWGCPALGQLFVHSAHWADDFGELSVMMSGLLPGLVPACLGPSPSLAWFRWLVPRCVMLWSFLECLRPGEISSSVSGSEDLTCMLICSPLSLPWRLFFSHSLYGSHFSLAFNHFCCPYFSCYIFSVIGEVEQPRVFKVWTSEDFK